MRRAAAFVLLALAPSLASAEVVVRVSEGRVDLTVTATPLADVLDRLARQTGMKVVYEGPPPRQLVTVSLHGRTPAETVLAVFEGLGLNYAMVADSTGAGVQTLMVAGVSSVAAASSTTPAASRPTVPNFRRPFGPPPGSSPDSVDPAFDEAEDEADMSEPDFPGLPPGLEIPDPSALTPGGAAPATAPAQNPAVPPQDVRPPPGLPALPFSASPFTPQPQPFPPVPPGAPTGANPPQPGEEKPQAPPQ